MEYKYDDLYRLVEEKIDGSHVIGYVYDLVGNRLRKVDSREGITSYTVSVQPSAVSRQQAYF